MGGGVGRQLEGLGRVVWVYKIGLKWESEKTRNRENGRERVREPEMGWEEWESDTGREGERFK